MGYSISWIAVRDRPKEDILNALDLVDTTEIDEANESPTSGATIAAGWYVLFLNKYDHPFTTQKYLAALSRSCMVIGCQVEEHVMASSAFMYQDGLPTWRIDHESEKGTYDLVVSGAVPIYFEDVQTEQKKQQDENGGDSSDVDYIFDVPIRVAARACGYRHDRWKFDWGEPSFTVLKPSKTRFWSR